MLDDHELSERARAYGEAVVRDDEWPLSELDRSKVGWATSTRAKRKNGYCAYEADGRCTVTVAEHVYDRAGFEACKETIRHELVHAWQHQHAGEFATRTDAGPAIDPGGRDGDGIRIEPGHGASFRAWIDPLDLSGRCSTPYARARDDFAYVFECPSCGDWWGRHRLCKRVRQAAHGKAGSAGYCYCTDCETLLYLRRGDRYLDHADHGDDAIRAFADGDGPPTTAAGLLAPASRPAADD